MTREKALQVSRLLEKIEMHEALLVEISELDSLAEISDLELDEELLCVVRNRLNILLKALEEL